MQLQINSTKRLRNMTILCALVGSLAAISAPATEFSTIVSSPSLWSMVNTDGEICELWTGPPNVGGAKSGLIPSPLRVSLHGSIRQGVGWLDLRSLDYTREGSRPGYLNLVNTEEGVTVRMTADRSAADGPIVVRYTFTQPHDFRFNVDLLNVPNPNLESNDALGLTEIATGGWGPLWIATAPTGHFVPSPVSPSRFAREMKNASEVVVCLKTAEKVPTGGGDIPLARKWLQQTEREQPDQAHRIRIRTGVRDFDEMLEASMDAIEANRFPNGVLIAGPDGPFYKGTWIRDGVYAALGDGLAGNHEGLDALFNYWIQDRGFSFGGENEAQQPAIAIVGLWYFSRLRLNGEEFLRETYPYVQHYAEYYTERVQREGMIHTAEEWICQIPSKTSWPNAEVHAGLRAASKIAGRLGHRTAAFRWSQSAETLRRAILETAYDEETQRFIPLAGRADEIHPPEPNEAAAGSMRDERVDSGMLMLARLEIFGRGLGVVAVDDPRFAATQAWIHRVLEQPDRAISRFDGNLDSRHYAKGEWYVWPISTAWAAQVEWLRGRSDRAWRYLLSGIIRKHGYDRTEAMYILPEYWSLDGRPGASTRFLTWSHGELLTGAILLLLGVDPEVSGADLALAPSLPMEMERASVENFRFRGWRFDFDIERKGTAVRAECTAHRGANEAAQRTLRLKLPQRTLEVRDGDSFTFTGRPSGPTARVVRGENAFARAELVDRILLNEELDPALKDAPKEELEAHLRASEDRFDRDYKSAERTRRQIELVNRSTASGTRDEEVLALTLPGDVEVKFCKIPAGRFWMGSPEDEPGRNEDEGPGHEVIFSEPFYLGMFEVTQAQWMAVMGSNPSRFTGHPGRPVEGVTWRMCQDFASRMNTLNMGTFRLPLEAEWEYACRAGSQTPYFWGEDSTGKEIDRYVWYDGSSGGRAHDAGRQRPNPWGLYDMGGNIWEWCWDTYRPYTAAPRIDPQKRTKQTSKPALNDRKVLRGGSWRLYSGYARSAHRAAISPDYRFRDLGLRLHRTYP